MKKAVVGSVLAVLLLVAVAVVFAGCRRKYEVHFNDALFTCRGQQHFYASGAQVKLAFPLVATDINYEFSVQGVEDFQTTADADGGYLICFQMPPNEVWVSYDTQNSMVYPVQPADCTISLEENPTTGYTWQCEVTPAGVLSVLQSEYESDANDDDPPLCGVGGTHTWYFTVENDGTAVVKLTLQRGPEEIVQQLEYHYRCEGGIATLVKTVELKT